MEKNLTEKQISNEIFELSEQNIYSMLDILNNNPSIDKTLVYCFIKAFYIHSLKLILQSHNYNLEFDNIYLEYKEKLKSYYKTNNPTISDEMLDDILNFFDNSYGIISSVDIKDIEDSYEYRHYVINVFELLRMILEKKSKSFIRENIFENYTKTIIETTELIYKCLKWKNE